LDADVILWGKNLNYVVVYSIYFIILGVLSNVFCVFLGYSFLSSYQRTVDGGNNDISFIKADLTLTLLDSLRPTDHLHYFPG
jgi:hypothetical protein